MRIDRQAIVGRHTRGQPPGIARPLRRRQLLLWSAAAGMLPSFTARAHEPSVVFINPGDERGDDLWPPLTRIMAAAATSLDMRLEVLHAQRDRARMLDLAIAVAARPTPPEFVVLVNEKGQAPAMLQALASCGTRVLLMHNDLTAEQRAVHGQERGRFAHWIGTLVIAERPVPRALMDTLYRRVGGTPRVLGITGDAATPIAAQVERLLRDYVLQVGRGETLQVVAGNWSRPDGEQKARDLLRRYPDANLIWAANDAMALGAWDAVAGSGLQGRVRVGGLGAFPAALDSVEAGGLTATVGGTVMVGAWAVVLLHDLWRGLDFASAGGPRQSYNTTLIADDPMSVRAIRQLVDTPERLDFRRYSRHFHRRPDYDFDVRPWIASPR